MWRIRRSMQVALGLAAIAAVAGSHTACAQTLLRWKFQPGATFRYVLTQQVQQTIQGGPKEPVTLTTTMSGDTLWKVESVGMKLPFVGVLAVEYKYKYLGRESRRGKALEKMVLTMGMKPPKEKPVKKDKEDAKDSTTPSFTFKEWTAEGDLYFDNATGRLVESEMRTQMKAEVAVLGKQATMDMKGTVRMELQPAKAAKKPAKP